MPLASDQNLSNLALGLIGGSRAFLFRHLTYYTIYVFSSLAHKTINLSDAWQTWVIDLVFLSGYAGSGSGDAEFLSVQT